jgi:7-cyano-7-deazaguanine synthase
MSDSSFSCTKSSGRRRKVGVKMARSAVVLLSGGIDSATALAVAKSRGFVCHALSVDYGQRHRRELSAARKIAAALETESHRILKVDLSVFGGSALTEAIPVPRFRSERKRSQSIPVTYVPARNTVLLSLALAWAETLGSMDIFIGVNAVDYSGYPDCRPEFIRSFQKTANIGTRAGVKGKPFRIHAPLQRLTKAEIISRGAELGVPFQWTLSCYDPDPKGRACGACDSCLIRQKGFFDAGVPDPTRYKFAKK